MLFYKEHLDHKVFMNEIKVVGTYRKSMKKTTKLL